MPIHVHTCLSGNEVADEKLRWFRPGEIRTKNFQCVLSI